MTYVHSPRSPRDRSVTTWDEHGRRARSELYYDPEGPFARQSQDIGFHNTYRRDGTIARVVKIYSLREGSPDLVETITFDERGNPIERFWDLNGDGRLGRGDAIYRTENHYDPEGRLLRSVETLSAVSTPRGRLEYRYDGEGKVPGVVFHPGSGDRAPPSRPPGRRAGLNSQGRSKSDGRRPRWDSIKSPNRSTHSYDEWGNLVTARSERWSRDGVGPRGGGPSLFVERHFNTYGAPGVLAKVQKSWGSPGHSTPPSKRRTTFYDECGRPSRFRHDPEGDGALGEWDVLSRYTYDCPCDPEAAR